MIESVIDDLIKLAPESVQFGNRIRPLARDAQLPACSFDVVGQNQQIYTDGSKGLTTADVSVKIYADTFKQCKTIAKSIQTSMTGYNGQISNIFILLTEFNDMQDDYNDEVNYYSTDITFTITYED